MLLAIDIGNTNVTIGIVEGGFIEGVRRTATNRASTTDELEIMLRDLLALDDHDLNGATAMAVASVVPAMTALVEAVAARLGIPTLVATSGTVPIPIRVDRPDLVGGDRIVNALAAVRLHGSPAIVCDLGTATTLDCVGADGAFVGGAIAPGLEVSVNALGERAARLFGIELATPPAAIGKNTAENMQSGAIFGFAGLVDGMVRRFAGELGSLSVIATGGLAGLVTPHCETVDEVAPWLTLDGLRLIWERNR